MRQQQTSAANVAGFAVRTSWDVTKELVNDWSVGSRGVLIGGQGWMLLGGKQTIPLRDTCTSVQRPKSRARFASSDTSRYCDCMLSRTCVALLGVEC